MPRSKKKKVEIVWDDNCCEGKKPWKMWKYHHGANGGGFFGRALFIIGVLYAMNTLGLLKGVANWVQWLIGIGFALMSF
jgi:hypothetical protein